MDTQNLSHSLVQWVAMGKLDMRVIHPVLGKLSPDFASPVSLADLLDAATVSQDPAMALLKAHLREVCRREILLFRERAASGRPHPEESLKALNGLPLNAPRQWDDNALPWDSFKGAMAAARDSLFLEGHAEAVPETTRLVDRQCREHAAILIQTLSSRGFLTDGALLENAGAHAPSPWPRETMGLLRAALARLESENRTAAREFLRSGPAVLPPEIDEQLAMEAWQDCWNTNPDETEQRRLLDRLCCWPTPGMAPLLAEAMESTGLSERAQLVLRLRFGIPSLTTGADWCHWLQAQDEAFREKRIGFHATLQSHAATVLRLWYSSLANPDPLVLQHLRAASATELGQVMSQAFLEKWADRIPDPERPYFGLDVVSPPVPAPPVLAPPVIAEPPMPVAVGFSPKTPPPAQQPQAPEARPRPLPPPPAPPAPSIWSEHIQPFFAGNWYFLAGIAMVIAGSSLVAFYTWDKHWLVRYTIMPALLAFFTWSLARVGGWIETRDATFKDTGAILRGAAIGLLPVNFMAVALLSGDKNVPGKSGAMLVMGLIYALFFGSGLRRWCGAVHPALGWPLGGTILFLNVIMLAGPVLGALDLAQGESVPQVMAGGFYTGFLLLAGVVVWFSKRVMTVALATEKRVPWFAGGTLILTFLQTFAWAYGSMHLTPHVHTYAAGVILAGWLVLFSERVSQQLQQTPLMHGGESFLGFAMVLGGLLMGAAHAEIRILVFLLAGVVWLRQAFLREHALHYWIALTLISLGGVSVTLLADFPGPWRPVAGIVLALMMIATQHVAERRRWSLLTDASQGMLSALLTLTTMVAVLSQWHYRSEPLWTGVGLAVVAALYLWRALRDERLTWLHTAMLVLAAALPYFGFVDMTQLTLHNNTLVAGLALLSLAWLGVNAVCATPLIRQARSTVLWFYGSLALVAMVLRVCLGDAAPDSQWLRNSLDYLGPLFMLVALILTTYFSRSLIPAGMAVAIVVILFPEMRANLEQTFASIHWGTGLGSACNALALMILCFFLRRWPFLRNLGEGDRFFGRDPFPLRRHDHSLFTLPILLAAAYLAIKVDTWSLVRNWSREGLELKTAVAVFLSGITWVLAAVYHRQDKNATRLVLFGYFWGAVGLACFCWRVTADPHWSQPVLCIGLTLQVLFWAFKHGLSKERDWADALLVQPTRHLLHYGAYLLLIVSMLVILIESEPVRSGWLLVFVAAQGIWHGLARREQPFGVLLFFLLWICLLVFATPGTGPFSDRSTPAMAVEPTLWMLAAIQLAMILFECLPRCIPPETTVADTTAPQPVAVSVYEKLYPLARPMFVLGSLCVILFALACLRDMTSARIVSLVQLGTLLGVLLLTARAHRSGPLLLLAMVMGYGLVHFTGMGTLDGIEERLLLLATPWRLAVFGLGMVLVTQAGRWLHGRCAVLFDGPYAEKAFTAPDTAWVCHPAAMLVCLAAIYHTVRGDYRDSATQLWTPYIGAAACAAIATFWKRSWCWGCAAGLVVLANLHLVRVFGGDWLRGHGLSELHLACIGFGLSLGLTSLLRLGIKRAEIIPVLNQGSLALAGMILGLLSVNYLTHSNLETISSTRFLASGALALMAGWYFRRAARHPGPGEEAHVDLTEACYHFGIVMAVWCAALMIPPMRQPTLALTALSLPMVFFYLRSELGMRCGATPARRYRNSATVLGFVILALYVFRGVLQMAAFPDKAIDTDHYHHNAPLLLVLSVILLRLHGLGGTMWLAFYGGLGVMSGGYFLLTALPGLSPFDSPIPSAWCAVGIGHFWILVSHNRSPLRTAIQRMAALDDTAWHQQRLWWGRCLLVAVHGSVLWGLSDFKSDTRMVAPLIAGAASILIHQGILRGSRPYLVLAGAELALALHADFLVPSWIARDAILWVVLGTWGVLRILHEIKPVRLASEAFDAMSACLGILAFAHILYQRPDTTASLAGMALLALLGAAHPIETCPSRRPAARGLAWLLLFVPLWMVYFGQVSPKERGLESLVATWPLVSTLATLVLTGAAAARHQLRWAAACHSMPRSRFFLFDQLLAGLEVHGERIHTATLSVGFVAAVAIQAAHYQERFEFREWVTLSSLFGFMAACWFARCRRAPGLVASYLLQLCVVGAFAVIRRQLMLSTSFWNYEYDVWTSLAVSFLLTGARPAFQGHSRPMHVSFLTSLCLLPVIAFVWVIIHGLGSNLALVVVGLHSLMFAYLGKDRRESPFNIVAVCGFVLFVLMTFWTKLHLQTLQAYVIPAGLGVLALLHLLRERIAPAARNAVRLITLLMMMGSAGYYALADARHPLTFNLTLILLCLLAMGMGSLMRVRLYLALGFTGLLVALLSLAAKVLIKADRSLQMTVIGILVLVLGAALVSGAVFYKTHRDKIDAGFQRWRKKFGDWE